MSVLQTILDYEKEGAWIDENFEELQDKHENEYIAVKNNEIVAEAEDLDSLIQKITKLKESLDDVFIQFIHAKDYSFIL